VSIVNIGYVGTTVVACFVEMGHFVINIDVDQDVTEAINAGQSPIHEPKLYTLVGINGGKPLTATTDYTNILNTDITFLVLHATDEDCRIGTNITETAVETVGSTLPEKENDLVVVTKITFVLTITEG
jgi:UDPglucose 6-dehydrogenase